MFNLPVELSWPGDSAGHWGQVPGNQGLRLVLLVRLSDGLQILPIIHQYPHVLLIHVQLCSSNALKLSQKFHCFFSLSQKLLHIMLYFDFILFLFMLYPVSFSLSLFFSPMYVSFSFLPYLSFSTSLFNLHILSPLSFSFSLSQQNMWLWLHAQKQWNSCQFVFTTSNLFHNCGIYMYILRNLTYIQLMCTCERHHTKVTGAQYLYSISDKFLIDLTLIIKTWNQR